MATIDEELKQMKGASPSAYTPFSQARGAEAIRGFSSGTAPRLSEPSSIFGASAQQSSQDFSRLQMPPTPNIPLGNTIPAFPDNYNQAMTDRSRSPSAMVSGLRDTTSNFGIYGGAAQLGSGQTPPMAPVTNTISSFGSPLASRTERIESPYGTASTTLTPEQQVMRAQARQQAEQAGTMPRTPEQQQTLLAQMRERGAGIRQAIAEQNKPNQEIINAFWQKKAEREAQQALTPSFGGYVGNEQKMRAANALIEAERLKQAQAGRSLISQEPINVGGMQFRQGSMGQYVPVRGFGSDWMKGFFGGGPQPASSSDNNLQKNVFGSAPTTRARQRATASMAGSTLERNLAIGGLGNPVLYNPQIQRRSGITV